MVYFRLNIFFMLTDAKRLFRANFDDHLERAGAAFAVYYKGRLVVDLWGGLRDKERDLAWERDTATVLFSTTKVQFSPIV